MKDLIAALESASGPDRQLDFEIGLQMGITKDLGTGKWIRLDDDNRIRTVEGGLPHYTASIDAALTLVPDGWPFKLITDFGSPRLKNYRAQITTPRFRESEIWSGGNNASPAIALTIAALKARDAEQ